MVDLYVDKYGGWATASFKNKEKTKKIIAEDSRRRIIVVSAPSKRWEDDKKITDKLIDLVKTNDDSIAKDIISRYQTIFLNQDFTEISDLLQQRRALSSSLTTDQYLAALKALGEEGCARMLAKEIPNAVYVDPKELFLVSTTNFKDAIIIPESEQMIKKRLSNLKKIAIIPGFYGYTKGGQIATFSRGESDTTGAYIAMSLNAQLYENFTNKDGISVVDPDLIPGAKKIKELTHGEMGDLAYLAFDILHENAVAYATKKGTHVHVRNILTYPSDGTHIVENRVSDPEHPIIGIAHKKGFCSFNIERFKLNKEIGIARKILQVFEDKEISTDFYPTGINNISVILEENQLEDVNIIGEIKKDLYSVLGQEAEIDFKENLATLAIVGKGLEGNLRAEADILYTLADKGIERKFGSTGPSRRCIIYGTTNANAERAVNAIYDKYLK